MWDFIQKIFTLENSFLAKLYYNIIAAIIILLIGFIAGKLVYRLSYKILKELEIGKAFQKAGIDMPIEKKISKILSYLIYFATVIFALNQLKIATPLLYILFTAVMIVIITTVLLSVKDFIPNMFAGFYIYYKGLLNIGDEIEVNGLKGRITEITLTRTSIRTPRGDTVIIPNSVMTKECVKKRKKTEKEPKTEK